MQNTKPTNLTKTVPLNEALQHFLAENIYVKRNSPSFINSAMDGFAFKHSNNKNNLCRTLLK
ncbi:hypothetical protein [Caminibacter profundus]